MKEERPECWQTFSNVFFCFKMARSRKEKKDSGGECVFQIEVETDRETVCCTVCVFVREIGGRELEGEMGEGWGSPTATRAP